MYKLLFGQTAIWNNAILLLRVWVGVIFIYHGLSIFRQGNMQDFADTLQALNIPIPLVSAWLCKSTEFFGGIFLVVGFLKRPACLFLIVDMAVATFVAGNGEVLQNGRTPFILLICCLSILLSSSDKLGIDWLILKNSKSRLPSVVSTIHL
jgi:putative oxidoreductase